MAYRQAGHISAVLDVSMVGGINSCLWGRQFTCSLGHVGACSRVLSYQRVDGIEGFRPADGDCARSISRSHIYGTVVNCRLIAEMSEQAH